MTSKIRNIANKKLNIGSRAFPVWQVATVTTAAFYLTYRVYKSMNKPVTSKYGYYTTAEEVIQGKDLSGLVIIVTGATAGLGKDTARYLALAGADVIMACRNIMKAGRVQQHLLKSLPKNIKGSLSIMELDLADLNSVTFFAKSFTQKYKKLDILVNNAGVSIPFYKESEQGFELQFGVNHMAHAYLAILMTPLLQKSDYGGRVVCLSSGAHRWTNLDKDFGQILMSEKGPNKESFKPKLGNYGITKTAGILFAHEYNRRHFEKYGISSYSLQPGLVGTDISRDFPTLMYVGSKLLFKLMAKTMSQGVATTLRCCTLTKEEVNQYNGEYFADCQPWSINKNLPKPWIKLGDTTLTPSHDRNINKDFEPLAKEFYDWTVRILKKQGMKFDV